MRLTYVGSAVLRALIRRRAERQCVTCPTAGHPPRVVLRRKIDRLADAEALSYHERARRHRRARPAL